MNTKRKITQIMSLLLAASMMVPDVIIPDVITSEGVTESVSEEKQETEENTDEKEEVVLTITKDTALFEDTVVDKLYVTSGTFNLNGHNLTVKGDVILNGTYNYGTLYINGGRLEVEGDLRLQSETKDNEGNIIYQDAFHSRLVMQKEEDYVKVNGSFTIGSGQDHSGQLTAGTLEIKGDFIQPSETRACFNPTGEFITVLSGDKQQTVTMNAVGSTFNELRISNTSKEGVLFSNYANWRSISGNKSGVSFSNGGKLGWKLEKDEVIDGDLILAGDTLDLNGNSLTVKGNLKQYSGTVNVNGGKLTVSGDYSITSEDDGLSSGKLIMQNEEDVLDVRGSLTTNSSISHSGILTEGTVKLGGDLVQLNRANLCMDGNIQLVLDGTEKQTVSYADAGNSTISILKIENTSEEGVELKNNIVVVTKLYDTKTPITGDGEIYIRKNAVLADNIWSGSLVSDQDYVLPADTEIKGNLYIPAGTFNLGEKKLKVGGNVILNSTYNYGTLYINGGRLEVEGDLRLQSETKDNEGNIIYQDAFNSRLVMQKEEDYVKVNGSFTIGSGQDHSGQLTAGTLEIKGDFIQPSEIRACFNPTGEFITVLSGDKQQTVTMNAVGSTFNELRISNTSKEGVLFANYANWRSISGNKSVVSFSNGGKLGWKLEKDEVIDGDLILFGDTMDLNGHTLTVRGNFSQPSGIVKINGGKLSVEGDYNITSAENGQSSGTLIMKSEEDVLDVRGNFTTNSSNNHSGLLKAGTVKIGGDLTQLNSSNLCMTDNIELILDGSEKQTVSYANADNSTIAILKIENTSEEGIELKNNIVVITKLYDTKTPITGNGEIYIRKNAVLADNTWSGTLISDQNYVLPEDTVIKGDLIISGGTFNLGYKKLKVDGSVILVSELNVNAGTLDVAGDFRMLERVLANDGTYTYHGAYSSSLLMQNDAAYVKVNGDFSINSYQDHKDRLTAGILEIKGNFTQESDWNRVCFNPSGTHKTILSGDKAVKVKFGAEGNGFNILEITNSIDNYTFSRKEPWQTLIESKTDTAAPTVPKNISSRTGSVSLTLTWDASEDDSKVRGYEVYRDGVRLTDVYTNEFTDENLEPEKKYVYQITAFDNSRNTSAKSEAFEVTTAADKEKPSAPEGLKLISQTSDSVNLTWGTASDNHKVYCYRIYRNGKLVGEVNGQSFEDRDVPAGMYEYTVSAVDASSNESEKSEVLSADLKPSEAPENLRAEYTDNTVIISWDAPEEGLTYYLYRKSDDDTAFAEKAAVTGLSYEDRNIKPGVRYEYKLTAVDVFGNVSEYSKVISASIEKDTVKPEISAFSSSTGKVLNNTTEFILKYSDNFDMASVKVEYKKSDDEKWTVLNSTEVAPDSLSLSLGVDVTGFETGKYSFRATVTDAAGNSCDPTECELEFHKTTLAVPELSVKTNNSQVQLSWTSTDDETFASYRIYRKEAGGEYSRIAEVSQNVFTDESKLNTEGVMYTYFVEIADKYGNVLKSKEKDIVITDEQDFSERPYGYALREGYAVITVSDLTAEKIVIPDEIEGLPVTMIGDMAFAGSSAKTIELPDTVKSIGYSAFRDCALLERVKVSDNTETISDEAFLNCPELKSVSAGNAKLKGEKIFGITRNDAGEESVDETFTITASLGSDGQKYALSRNMNFKPSDCEYIVGEDSVSIISYRGTNKSLAIPDRIQNKPVKSISGSAFKSNEYIEQIKLPETVEEIGSYAFMNCINLSSVDFAAGALKKCGSDFLYNTAFEKSCTSEFMILGGNYLYRYKGSNINVTVPQEVEIIGCDAFADCDFINSISISEGVKHILSGSFFGCEGLTEIVIPDSVESIGDYAFSYCQNLEDAVIPEKTARGKDIFFECNSYKGK